MWLELDVWKVRQNESRLSTQASLVSRVAKIKCTIVPEERWLHGREKSFTDLTASSLRRCEPYCKCSLMFLVGDYHLGRSCRLRSRPPPNFDATTDDRQETWQKAWGDMWHSQLSSEGDDHDHLSNFIPPLFQQREDPQTAFQWDTSMSCDLPPDNHYMKLTTVASNAFKKTVGVTEQLDRLKTGSSTLIGQAKANVQQARFAACAFVKTKLQERARIRGDIVLSQQGALVLKKMCGSYVGADSEVKAETD